MSSTISAAATATVTSFVTITASPTPLAFFDTCWSTLMTVNIALFLLSLVVVGLLGLSTLSIFPIILPVCFAIGNGLNYYAFVAQKYTTHAREVAAAFGYIYLNLGSFLLPFYSFVILNRILQFGERRFFLYGFTLFCILSIGARVPEIVCGVRLVRQPNNAILLDIRNTSTLATFVILAATELFNAYFLIKTFNASKRTAAAGGRAKSERLMKQLCLSTEIRLSGIAIPGILRALVYPFVPNANTRSTRATSAALDRFGAVLENVFPVVLMMDLLITKYWGIASRKSSSKQSGILMGQTDAASAAVKRHERKKKVRPGFWQAKTKNLSEQAIPQDSTLAESQTMGNSETLEASEASGSATAQAEHIGPLDERIVERDPTQSV